MPEEPKGTETQEPEGLLVPVVTETPPVEGSGSNGTTGTGEPPKGDAHKHTVPAKTFTQEDIERIRKEEKDKLYKSIEDMKSQVSNLTKEREEREAALKKQQEDAEAAARAKAEEEMSAKQLLQQKEQEWEQRFQQIEEDRQRSDALLEREREFSQLQEYRTQRLAAESENIMPELLDYVTGLSKEEIDASIALAIEKTNAVVGNFQQAAQQQRQQAKGASITSPPTGPIEDTQQGYETMSADDIRGMDMATYAKNRDRLMKAASNNRNRGLFG